MIERVVVRRGEYHDSVTLMLISRESARLDGVQDVAAVSGTPLNLELLTRNGYALDAEPPAGPNDLVIAVRVADDETLDAVLAEIDDRLERHAATVPGGGVQAPPRSLTAAARRRGDLNLALLSIPGRHVPYEAAVALRAGMHVFCFADAVGLEQEAALKRTALQRGLLFMGPDCGTAIIDGVALGFANVVEPGPVGIVGASGTGIQEVSSLLDAVGVGISQAIGVGGRDLTAAVGGLMTERALELLAQDAATEVVVVVSKPPDPAVAARVTERAAALGKPAVLAFLGGTAPTDSSAGVTVVSTLEEAARAAATLVGDAAAWPVVETVAASGSGHLRGLFCGGTLCDEAMAIAAERLGPIASNIPLRPEWRLADSAVSAGHTFIDFGDDEFTQGRAHPMIDPSLRVERLAREAADPGVGALLLDVVLGHGSHPDPAAALAPAISEALARRASGLTVVVSLCGTAGDPQDLAAQRAQLERAGAFVVRGNAAAARAAVAAVGASAVTA
jgi:FdrA protein